MPARPLDLFRRLSTGVYVVSAAHGGREGAFTAAWLTQVSLEPLLLALSVNPGNTTWELMRDAGAFVINVLRDGQLEHARHFGTTSGRDVDKLAVGAWERRRASAPIFLAAVAWLDCRIQQTVPAGDHRLVIAAVVDGDLLAPDAEPLLYAHTGDMDGSASLFPSAW